MDLFRQIFIYKNLILDDISSANIINNEFWAS